MIYSRLASPGSSPAARPRFGSHDLLETRLTGLLACGAASFRLELLTRDSPHRAPRLRRGPVSARTSYSGLTSPGSSPAARPRFGSNFLLGAHLTGLLACGEAARFGSNFISR